ncbi:MAG: lamin tail domain-containing protein [Candidatus Aenigmarchaeota archaeon]|nr:lamin tail domain-containing protein [Candidatus Aenigmarchaeota archaeon]
MNILYLVPLLIVAGLAVGASVFFFQDNMTGYLSSAGTDYKKEVHSSIVNETKCPASCDDNNPCTFDWCNQTSNYKCSHTAINGTSKECWGNSDVCVTNVCISGKCTKVTSNNCCGNKICESNESCSSCEEDCGECPPTIAPTEQKPVQIATQQQSQSNQALVPDASTENQSNATSNQTSNVANQTNETATLNHIIINEFITRGPNGTYDEFTELYNPTNNNIDITGWKLQYKSATGDTWQSKVGSGLAGTIKSKSFFLLASKGYSLNTVPDYLHSANWGFADTGGHVRIIDSNGTVIDKVGWGNANEPEGSVALTPEEDKSLERKSLTDTDDNSIDFISSVPSPTSSK